MKKKSQKFVAPVSCSQWSVQIFSYVGNRCAVRWRRL